MVINAKFDPFSFLEMLAPVQMETQEYNNIMDQYDTLANKASVWESMIDLDRDKLIYKMYKDYSDELRSLSDQMAQNGLDSKSRRNLSNMNRMYGEKIVPIETAYNKRNEFINKLLDAKMRDGTIMFDRNFSNVSLNDMIDNPTLSFNAISGDHLTRLVAEQASKLATLIFENPRLFKGILNSAFGPLYYETMIRNGYSPDLVKQAIMNDPGASLILTGIVDSVLQSSGVDNFDERSQFMAREYANRGLYSAIGGLKFDTLSNKMFDYNQLMQIARTKTGKSDDESLDNGSNIYTVDDVSGVGESGNSFGGENGDYNKAKKLNAELVGLKQNIESGSKSMVTSSLYNSKLKELNKLLDKYLVSDMLQLDLLSEQYLSLLKPNAVINRLYNLRMTDKKFLTDNIMEKISTLALAGEGRARGIREIDGKGRISNKDIEIKDLRSAFKGDYSIGVKNGLTIISFVDEDDKSRKVVIPLDYTDFGYYNYYVKAGQEFSNAKDYKSADVAYRNALNTMYGFSTDAAKAQTGTKSKFGKDEE